MCGSLLYFHFRVGAALQRGKGILRKEHGEATSGLSICVRRGQARSRRHYLMRGKGIFKARDMEDSVEETAVPSGVCQQTLIEFGEKIAVNKGGRRVCCNGRGAAPGGVYGEVYGEINQHFLIYI